MPANSILIADDDEKLLSVLLSYFKDEQFTVYLARDGGEALKRLKEDHPDIMVLDIMMPGIDGFEVCRRARQFTDIPIIFLSAKDDEADRLVGLHLGADDYVVKPFHVRELIARVKSFLRRRRGEVLSQVASYEIRDLFIDKERLKYAGKRRGFPLPQRNSACLISLPLHRIVSLAACSSWKRPWAAPITKVRNGPLIPISGTSERSWNRIRPNQSIL